MELHFTNQHNGEPSCYCYLNRTVVVWSTFVLFPVVLSLVFIWPNELQIHNPKEPSVAAEHEPEMGHNKILVYSSVHSFTVSLYLVSAYYVIN